MSMCTLNGILLDVSASMKENIHRDNLPSRIGPWARSIFNVIDNLIKHDVSSGNLVFAIGFGAPCGSGTFDVLGTIRERSAISNDGEDEEINGPTMRMPEMVDRAFSILEANGAPFVRKWASPDERSAISNDGEDEEINGPTMRMPEMVDRAFSILEANGAPFVRKWASPDVICSTLYPKEAEMMLKNLKTDKRFLRSFIVDCLPSVCRDAESTGASSFFLGQQVLNAAKSRAEDAYIKLTGRQADVQEILKVLTKAKSLMLVNVSEESVFSVQEASRILHGCVDDKKLTDARVSELLTSVEPFIYGRTPFFTALEQAADLLTKPIYENHKKLLFILSDGDPTDAEKRLSLSRLRSAGVTVVCCYITKKDVREPMRLYSNEQKTWDAAARFMYGLSSTLPTKLLPRTIFIKRGWKIDIENNETRLFVQVNHSEIINDVCDLARNVVCNQDALADVLSCVSLDLYINQCNTGFNAKKQRGGTCYANASAAVLHLAMKRIVGRDGGYPEFNVLRECMIQKYGEDGANTLKVLQEVCPTYRLQCRVVDISGALQAITAKRPLVARFRLTDGEWDSFSWFFDKYNNPTGVLTKQEIDISSRLPGERTSGHAVVLTSFNSECLRLMNSWGSSWADMGFFRIRSADVLGLEFFDVYWTLLDLSPSEKAYYEEYGDQLAADLVASLRGLQLAKYECPLCEKRSLATQFTGKLLRAMCPRCKRDFCCGESGNILALNLYLTSLGR